MLVLRSRDVGASDKIGICMHARKENVFLLNILETCLANILRLQRCSNISSPILLQLLEFLLYETFEFKQPSCGAKCMARRRSIMLVIQLKYIYNFYAMELGGAGDSPVLSNTHTHTPSIIFHALW